MLFPIDLLEVRGGNSTLFQAGFITNWTHHVTFPFNEGSSVPKPVADVVEGLPIGVAGEVEVLDEHLSQDDIEGRLSIEIEDEDGELKGEE